MFMLFIITFYILIIRKSDESDFESQSNEIPITFIHRINKQVIISHICYKRDIDIFTDQEPVYSWVNHKFCILSYAFLNKYYTLVFSHFVASQILFLQLKVEDS